MKSATSAQLFANTARMRGDRRRYVPILLLQFGVDVVGLGGMDVTHKYRVIGVPSLDVARETKEILIGEGWYENIVPDRLRGASFSLAPPNSNCGHRESNPAHFGQGSRAASDNEHANELAGSPDDSGQGAPEVKAHAPNLRALAILNQLHDRQRDRLSSRSDRTQEYLREARSGGMFGNGDGGNE
jgi:hypothetical protein